MSDVLAVFLHDDFIGEVAPYRLGRRSDKHRVLFRWEEEFAPGPVTLTESFASLPGTTPDATLVSNFFGGYVPDGNQREAMARQRGIDPQNLFELLQEFGGSIGGAITFRAPDESGYVPRYDAIDEATVARRLRQAVEQHDLGIQDDSRSMIPGYQPKLLLASFDDRWHEPHGRAHSTHILKPKLESRPFTIYNEFYSHELSRHMGLSRFASSLERVGQVEFLAIERFDRFVTDGAVTLAHQEDFAQALGLDWRDSEAKFQDSGWPNNPAKPSALRIAELTGSLPDATEVTTDWLRQLTFHVLVGNNDGHAKNVALLHDARGTRLSELYDAVPNFHQPGRISWDMAMAVNGAFDHRSMSVERLIREATSWGVLSGSRIESTIAATIQGFTDAQTAVDLPTGLEPGVAERLQWNADRLARGDEIGRPKERTGL